MRTSAPRACALHFCRGRGDTAPLWRVCRYLPWLNNQWASTAEAAFHCIQVPRAGAAGGGNGESGTHQQRRICTQQPITSQPPVPATMNQMSLGTVGLPPPCSLLQQKQCPADSTGRSVALPSGLLRHHRRCTPTANPLRPQQPNCAAPRHPTPPTSHSLTKANRCINMDGRLAPQRQAHLLCALRQSAARQQRQQAACEYCPRRFAPGPAWAACVRTGMCAR